MNLKKENVIGFILKGYPRLSETFITNEILLLEQLGYKLHIFALRNPGEAKVHESVRRIQARVTYIPDYFWRFFFAFMNASLRLCWRHPLLFWSALLFAVRHSVCHFDSSTTKRFFQAAYLVQKSLPGTDVVHFHAHFSNDPTTVAFFASRLAGMNYSFSAHAKDIYVQERDFLHRKIAQARFVVTCTEHNKNYLSRLGKAGMATTTPIMRCYHGTDLRYFSAAAKPELGVCPRILSVGRLVPKKGFPVLIQALHLLRQRGFDFRCTIIGTGPLENEMRKQITGLSLDNNVELISQMSQNELIKYYHAADLFALACEVQDDGDRDGIPNVIVEAMAMEIPVVSTRISGIPECVDHNLNGILVAEKDPTALAEGLARLLSQPAVARQLGRAGRKKIEQDFDAWRNVGQIGAALHQAITNNGQKPVKSTVEGEAYDPSSIRISHHYDTTAAAPDC